MKVLLIEPYKNKRDNLDKNYTYPAPGLLSIASYLESNGIEADYFPSNTYKNSQAPLKKALKKKYDFIGVGTTGYTLKNDLKHIELVKKYSPNSKVVAGGIYAWLFPQDILKHSDADYVIRGNGEIPFLKLIQKNKIVPGLCTKTNISKPFIISNKELAKLPSIIKYSKYNETYKKYHATRRQLFATLGCPFNCNFCSVPHMYNHEMRYKPTDLVIADLKELQKQKIKKVFFVDPDLNVNKKYFLELFGKIFINKLNNISFSIQARIDLIDKDIIKASKKANIKYFFIGVESISQKIRDKDLNKGGKMAKMNEKEIILKLKELKENKITPFIYLILGTPLTTIKELKENISFYNSFKGSYELNPLIFPHKETNYYKMYKDSLILHCDLETKYGILSLPSVLYCKDKKANSLILSADKEAFKELKKNKKKHYPSVFMKLLNEKIESI